MQVAFYKAGEGRLCGWTAAPPRRRRFTGTTMASGRDLPHDLAQFVVEQWLGLEHGFWGVLAQGGSFKSVPGRRQTQPGRQITREHQAELGRAEAIVNAHVNAWKTGTATPVGAALDAMLVRWRALALGDELRLNWNVQGRRGHRTRDETADDAGGMGTG
jgi:hypothetical protein